LFIITGLILLVTDRVATEGRQFPAIDTLDTVIIGRAQGLAIIPALSRSGSTIAAGIFLGLDRAFLV